MLTDDECLALLEKIALGRNQKQMAYLAHVAHEGVARATERTKHGAMHASLHRTALAKSLTPEQVKADWQALKGHLLDGQGSHIIDITLGLAVAALLDDKPDEFEFQLRALFKSALLGLPHVLRGQMSQRMPRPGPAPAQLSDTTLPAGGKP